MWLFQQDGQWRHIIVGVLCTLLCALIFTISHLLPWSLMNQSLIHACIQMAKNSDRWNFENQAFCVQYISTYEARHWYWLKVDASKGYLISYTSPKRTLPTVFQNPVCLDSGYQAEVVFAAAHKILHSVYQKKKIITYWEVPWTLLK